MTEEGEAPDAGREDGDGGKADAEDVDGPSAAGADRDDEGSDPDTDQDREEREPAGPPSTPDDESGPADLDHGRDPGDGGSPTSGPGSSGRGHVDVEGTDGQEENVPGTVADEAPGGETSTDGASGEPRAGEGSGARAVDDRDEDVPTDAEEDVRPSVEEDASATADESAAAKDASPESGPSGGDRSTVDDDPESAVGAEDAAAVGGGTAAGQADVRGAGDGEPAVEGAGGPPGAEAADVPEDVRTYDRFQKVDRASYDRVNEFLRDRTYVTAREWAIARLCADFRTATGVEMTKIGENLPHLVPFMTDTYSPQAVNQARSAFEEKVRMAGATFLYGAMSGFFTADELDEIMYEVTEVAKFLLEVEGVELTVDEELDAEDRISAVMREVRQASEELRHEEVECPECGHTIHEPGLDAGTE